MKLSNTKIALFVYILALNACSTNISSSIKVPSISPIKVSSPIDTGDARDNELQIADVLDERPSMVVGTLKNKTCEFSGDAVSPVRDAIKTTFKNNNFIFVNNAPLVLTIKLKRWDAEIKAGMPAEVNAFAKIAIEVKDPALRKIYGGNYEGSIFMKQSGIGDQELSKALSAAMAEAIKQTILDEKLMRVLSSF
jgi:hypothetical protein